jgi:hypothetical protein
MFNFIGAQKDLRMFKSPGTRKTMYVVVPRHQNAAKFKYFETTITNLN